MNTGYELVAGIEPEKITRHCVLEPFSDTAVSFLQALSTELLNSRKYRNSPILVALGFWLRESHLAKLRVEHAAHDSGFMLRPAGIVFHLTPANVDNLFVYSWAASLLCGNANIIRLSSRVANSERGQLLEVMKQLLNEPQHLAIKERTAIVMYQHDDTITNDLSQRISRRVLWGGDDTIAHFRSLPIPPLCQDIVFPDRRSAALLSAQAILNGGKLGGLIDDLYRDVYGFSQMACSSPRLLMWLADGDVEAAKKRFWAEFEKLIRCRQPALDASTAMNKQVALQSMAIMEDVQIRSLADNRLHVVELAEPALVLEALHPGGGLLLEGVIEHLQSIDQWLDGEHQTLIYFGIDRDVMQQIQHQSVIPLADRIVPVGQALDFDVIWDGMDLFSRLSRVVKVQ